MASLGFEGLADRLVRYLNELVQRGELSERGLAKLSGYSQPHIHNVLHGARALNIAMADRLLATMGIPLTALLTPEELSGGLPAQPVQATPTPILSGFLGGGEAFPRDAAHPGLHFLPGRTLEDLINPALARLSSSERSAWPALWPLDLVLLDRSPHRRGRPDLDSLYALEWEGRGYVCRCRRMGESLLTVTDSEGSPEPPPRIKLAPGELLRTVRGVIVWISRDLRESGVR